MLVTVCLALSVQLSRAVKQLNCRHRLILSGTPIQNNVLELWSLFDFLLPGFLGSEKQFQVRYGRPILASRDAKSSSKEQEAGEREERTGRVEGRGKTEGK